MRRRSRSGVLQQGAGFGLQGGHELDEPNYRLVLRLLFGGQFAVIALLTQPLNPLLQVGTCPERNNASGDFRRETLAQRIDQFIFRLKVDAGLSEVNRIGWLGSGSPAQEPRFSQRSKIEPGSGRELPGLGARLGCLNHGTPAVSPSLPDAGGSRRGLGRGGI